MELAHGLVEPRQVVGGGNGDGVVVMLIVFTLRFGSLQRGQEVFLLFNKRIIKRVYRQNPKQIKCYPILKQTFPQFPILFHSILPNAILSSVP